MVKLMRALLVAVLVVPALASAQVSLGLRVGYAIPGGDLQKSATLSDQISSQVPIQADLMYRLSPQAAAGVYASYGIGQVASQLKDQSALLVGPGASYAATIWRVGVQGTYSFPQGAWTPWIGLGSGLEAASFEVKQGPAKITGSTRGWEYLNLQAGADLQVSPAFRTGLFVSWAVGTYHYQGGEVSGTSSPLDGSSGGGLGSDAASHNWFTVGLRGSFDL